MCGRFTLFASPTEIAQQFQIKESFSTNPRYNIAPSQPIWGVTQTEGHRILQEMQWGLIPHWVKDLKQWKANLINARAETVSEKASFQSAFQHRPCLIPTTGFYEWSRDKQPFYFRVKEQSLFALAGLWESWHNGEQKLLTCTIITTKANAQVAPIHSRMPLILPPHDYERWLLGTVADRQALFESSANKLSLEGYAVSQKVNNSRYDDSDCLQRVLNSGVEVV